MDQVFLVYSDPNSDTGTDLTQKSTQFGTECLVIVYI